LVQLSNRRIDALVPLRSLAGAKSRLTSVLAESARVRLVEDMLGVVLAALQRVPAVASIAVVSQAPLVLPAGVVRIADAGDGLNVALTTAVAARPEPHGEVLIVAADLPLIDAAAIVRLLVAGEGADAAIARDRAGQGTNALWLRRPGDFGLQFGVGSARAHAREALRLGWRLVASDVPALAFDVDTAADLRDLQALRLRAAS
jgi:2-phospho-L-lactate/phosphoenolpyruvate guanylyltransferase